MRKSVESLEGVAEIVWQIAQQRTATLMSIKVMLEDGRNEDALEAMRNYVGSKKPVARIELHAEGCREQVQ